MAGYRHDSAGVVFVGEGGVWVGRSMWGDLSLSLTGIPPRTHTYTCCDSHMSEEGEEMDVYTAESLRVCSGIYRYILPNTS